MAPNGLLVAEQYVLFSIAYALSLIVTARVLDQGKHLSHLLSPFNELSSGRVEHKYYEACSERCWLKVDPDPN